MIDNDTKEFWNTQTSSLHRSNDDAFYAEKAQDHVSFMAPRDRTLASIDLGCGAGELLVYLAKDIDVREGLDYSRSMLEAARDRLGGSGIALSDADIFTHLPETSHPVWLTTGALNQYLDRERLDAFLDLFAANPAARSLYLFDCVDPIRYSFLTFGLQYAAPAQTLASGGMRELARRARAFVRRARLAALFALGGFERTPIPLGRAAMGYGHKPRYWLEAAAKRGLEAKIGSSRQYEYRYHVALRKPDA